MDMKVYRSATDGGYSLHGTLSFMEVEAVREQIVRRAIETAAEKLADQFITDHGQAVLASLDPQAIANLAVADSGRAVREALEKQIPREVQHHYHHDRVVYKVGIFGGIKRVR